jgi:two-component system sensor histidine kinase PilS (NtrC family)
VELNPAVSKICSDWQNQTQCMRRLRVDLSAEAVNVRFEAEDLRRILVNLLDNAIRHASDQDNAIQVAAGKSAANQSLLRVWSDGQPMDQSVERHLFEPFFSSNSRSSGLGLYICRELCEKHGASIAYHRTWRSIREQRIEGNEFLVSFLTC